MRKYIRTSLLMYGIILVVVANAATTKVYDSVKISHVTDGNTGEWKTDKFETDKETRILFSVDHDEQNLYLAMRIPDQRMQMKMIFQGMNLFIDKKGKRKEGTGIEFPIKRENAAASFRADGGDKPGTNQDPGQAKEAVDAMREKLSAMMIFLKIFGFDGQDDKTQLITVENGINLAFDWDEKNVLSIEYQIPMNFLGGKETLNGKVLGIGWRINGFETSSVSQTPSITTTSGGRGGGGGSRGGSSLPQATAFGRGSAPQNTGSRELSFWTKYMVGL